jgi:hypothetical protein
MIKLVPKGFESIVTVTTASRTFVDEKKVLKNEKNFKTLF